MNSKSLFSLETFLMDPFHERTLSTFLGALFIPQNVIDDKEVFTFSSNVNQITLNKKC
jgi:hypothetical protein